MMTIHTTMIKYSILSLLTALLALTSCTTEQPVTTGGEQRVQITIDATTRGTPEAGDPADRAIRSLRVLGYRTPEGTLAFNRQVDVQTYAPIDVLTGKYTVVLIANEHEDENLPTELSGITESNNHTLDYLRSLGFSYEAFDTEKDIPMTAVKNNVVIQGDNKLIDDGALCTGTWQVTLTRLGVRIDLTMTLPGEMFDDWFTGERTIWFDNVPERVALFPQDDAASALTQPGDVFTTYGGSNPAASEGKKTIAIRRIILPESRFTPVGDDGMAIILRIAAGSEPRTGIIAPNAPADYTLPRNSYLDVNAEANDREFLFQVNAIENWEDTPINHDL